MMDDLYHNKKKKYKNIFFGQRVTSQHEIEKHFITNT